MVLWLLREEPIQSAEPQLVAQSEAPTPPREAFAPEVSAAHEEPSRESIGAPGPQAIRPPSLAATPGGATVIVHVLAKESGKPLRSVRVILWPKPAEDGHGVRNVDKSSGTIEEALRPGDDGTVEFTNVSPSKKLHLSIYSDFGAASAAEKDLDPLSIGEHRELRVELLTQNDLTFVGRVIARADHAPIAGAHIGMGSSMTRASSRRDDMSNRSGKAERSRGDVGDAITEGEGVFEISVATWKSPSLRVEAEGFAPAIIVPNHGHETRDTARTIELDKSATLRGRIIDSSRAPISGDQVTVSTPGYTLRRYDEGESESSSYVPLGDEHWDASSKPDGTCTIESLPPAIPLHVEIRSGAKIVFRSPDPLILTAGETRELEWCLGVGCNLSGVALDQDGHPVASTDIWLVKGIRASPYFHPYVGNDKVASSRTNDEGRFEFKDVTAGTWFVGPAAHYSSERRSVEASVAPLTERVEVGSSPSQEIVLHLFRGLYIRGRVVDPNGAPVAHAWISGGLDPDLFSVDASSEKDGSFTLGPLGPGSFTLQAGGSPFAHSDIVKVETGARDVVIRLRAGAALRGRIIDAQTGAAITGELMLTPETILPGPLGQGFSTGAQADGSFEIEGLEPGRYGLVASAQGGRFGVLAGIDAPANQTVKDLDISVLPGGTLRMRYDGTKDGVSIRIGTGGGLNVCWGEEVTRSKALEKRVPQGSLQLQVIGEDGTKQRVVNVEVGAGETKEVVIHDE
jgi:hypothetical protein